MSSRPIPARPAAPPVPAPALDAGGSPAWSELYDLAVHSLGDPREARWLLEEVAGDRWASLRAHVDEPAPEEAHGALLELVRRRRSGEPLQHVLGHWSFRRLELLVDDRALIPRPETEVVVELALAELDAAGPPHPARGGGPGQLLAADLGTGSGAIACSLVTERRNVAVLAIDRSPRALSLAAANVARLDHRAASRVRLLRADWYGPLRCAPPAGLNLVVANPPYLAEEELVGLDPVVRDHEPREALVAGPSGLEAVAAVVGGAPSVLAAGGALVVEIAPAQAAPVLELARAAGAREARVEPDLTGRERALVARW